MHLKAGTSSPTLPSREERIPATTEGLRYSPDHRRAGDALQCVPTSARRLRASRLLALDQAEVRQYLQGAFEVVQVVEIDVGALDLIERRQIVVEGLHAVRNRVLGGLLGEVLLRLDIEQEADEGIRLLSVLG